MEEEDKYSKNTLNQSTYRYLQQLAKTMGLPCNVKKVYLIELIRAKKYSTEGEVRSIVERVTMERQRLAQLRRSFKRANLKSNEIHYKKLLSPPITTTPKRTNVAVRCSPNLRQAIIKYRPRPTHRTYSSPKQNGSDRVLRSFNLKTINRNIDYNALLSIKENRSPKKTLIEIVSHEGNVPKFNVTAKCLVKQNPALNSSTSSRGFDNRILMQARAKISPPVKRQRTVSGIYPLHTKETTKYGYLQSVGLRGRDGKIAKIHALVQKRSENYELNIRKPEINLQDIVNCKIDQNIANSNLMEYVLADNINNNYLQYPLMPIDKDVQNLEVSEQFNIRSNEDDVHSLYYHKKIRAEKVRCNRFYNMRDHIEERLPKINDVFSQFKDVTQPLYVQVNDTEINDLHTMYPRNSNMLNNNNSMLENIYNIKPQYILNQPLLQITTTSNTKCVYSTSLIATPRAQPSSTVVFAEPYVASGETYNVGFSRLNSFYQDVNNSEHDCTSIPEMVEDAMEIISQDGDYMERIGMDIRIQCMLCTWAGPMVMLEYHIKKEHFDQIYKQNKTEWNITFTLGSLVQCQVCLSQIIEYESTLYIISAKYEDPDCFMASVSTLCSLQENQHVGSITIYNKVTGEPHQWNGKILPLQPVELQQSQVSGLQDHHGLTVELSKLDLLPNSANLKLLNRELVNNSPFKVVVGQPELNDIHIILFIKILE